MARTPPMRYLVAAFLVLVVIAANAVMGIRQNREGRKMAEATQCRNYMRMLASVMCYSCVCEHGSYPESLLQVWDYVDDERQSADRWMARRCPELFVCPADKTGHWKLEVISANRKTVDLLSSYVPVRARALGRLFCQAHAEGLEEGQELKDLLAYAERAGIDPSEIVILYEREPLHKVSNAIPRKPLLFGHHNVVFLDNHAELLSTDELAEALQRTRDVLTDLGNRPATVGP